MVALVSVSFDSPQKFFVLNSAKDNISQTSISVNNGLLFILGKFIAYFAIGTFSYHLVTSIGDTIIPGMRMAAQLIMAAAAIVMAVLHIRDFFLARQEKYGKIQMQIPPKLRGVFHGMMKKLADHPGYFGIGCLLLGLLISAGEFLCTGQIYIASIIYAVQNIGGPRVYLFFTLYVAAAVLPALAILLLLWRGKASFEVSETLRANMPRIRLAAGLFFLAFAVYFIVTAF